MVKALGIEDLIGAHEQGHFEQVHYYGFEIAVLISQLSGIGEDTLHILSEIYSDLFALEWLIEIHRIDPDRARGIFYFWARQNALFCTPRVDVLSKEEVLIAITRFSLQNKEGVALNWKNLTFAVADLKNLLHGIFSEIVLDTIIMYLKTSFRQNHFVFLTGHFNQLF